MTAQTLRSRNRASVREVLGLSDPLGVVSVYQGAVDAATPGSTPIRELEVELARLRRRVAGSWTIDPAPARAALSEIEQRVRGATLSGDARDLALFAALGHGDLAVLEPGAPVPTFASLGSRADVRPLWLAFEEARPAGVALVSAEGVRLLEWVPGSLVELWSDALPELEERDLVGPAHAHPRGQPGSAPGFTVSQQRDLFERRLRGERERFLTGAGRTVGELAAGHEWAELVLSGDDRLTAALERGLPVGVPFEVVPARGLEQWRSPGDLAGHVAVAVATARELRAARLVEQVLAAGARAALGLGETLGALNDARVDTLFVAAEARPAGRTSPSGMLAAPGETPPGADVELVDDPMLADAMIARALDTGAEVLVLPPAAAERLGDDVAALLRY